MHMLKKQQQLFESISVKFLINLPYDEKKDHARLSFHAQKAYYYYVDEILNLKTQSDLNRNDLRFQFFNKLKNYAPKYLQINPQTIMNKLSQYKPTCGAIIFNTNNSKILVLKNKEKFGFPKGKWNQQQNPYQCAAREVYQETGIHIHKKINPEQKVQSFNKEGVPSVFYIVRGINENQRIKIDKKQVESIFWMRVQEVQKYIYKFVSKSKIAWKQYIEQFNQSKPKIQDFIQTYKPSSITQIKYQEDVNPFLNFKLDVQKLMKVFAK